METAQTQKKTQGTQPMKNRVFIFMLAALAASIGIVFWVGIYSPVDSHSTKTVTFVVQKGEGGREISYHLEQQGLIQSAPLFRIWSVTFPLAQKLKAGTYSLSPSMSAAQIAKKLYEGDVIKEYITIPEGFTLQDIAKLFSKQGRFTPQNFLSLVTADFSQNFSFLKDKPAQANLEGYLFPDTYQITREQSLQDIIREILQNFGQHFTQNLQDETLKQRKTIFQVVTMASILEKEVQTPDDKKLVAGILWKRLQLGMPLQVDAAPETYAHKGLPKNPVSNPGIESITAALYPTASPYLFYLSTKTGKTIFSRTLQEHDIAKAKYLRRY